MALFAMAHMTCNDYKEGAQCMEGLGGTHHAGAAISLHRPSPQPVLDH